MCELIVSRTFQFSFLSIILGALLNKLLFLLLLWQAFKVTFDITDGVSCITLATLAGKHF